MIPLFRVNMSPTAKEAVAKVLDSGYVGQGPKVEFFEKMLEEVYGVKPLATSGCTHALDLAYHLAHLSPGSKVISTPMTCTASNSPLVNRYCLIKWADIEAVVVVDWAGRQVDTKRISEIVTPYHIPVIEDAAHVFFKHHDKYPPNWYTAYSYGAIKHLTTVTGGSLIVPPEQYERAKLLRWFGLDRTANELCRCLHPGTKIRIVGKHSQRISTVVKNRERGPVWVMEDGHLVPRKIVKWFETPLNGRKYVRMHGRTFGPSFKTTVTSDHKIRTPTGWINAGNLRNGDKFYTSLPDMSPIQRQIIIGSLLGDAYMACPPHKSKGAGRATLTENHTKRDEKYTMVKVEALSGLGAHAIQRPVDSRHPYGTVQYNTRALPCFVELKNAFYPIHKKVVPRNILKKEFSDLMFAVWFMDDGHTSIINQREGLIPACQLATNGFTKRDVKFLEGFLSQRGYECTMQKSTSGWLLRFTKKGSAALVDAISPYVLPHMRYKVGHLSYLRPFNLNLYGDGSSAVFIDECVVDVPPKDEYRTVFCIEVEGGGHNFGTTNAIVHNCSQDIPEAGYSYNMSDVQAAIGIENAALGIKSVFEARNNAHYYEETFAKLKTVATPPPDPNSSWWLYVLKTPKRDKFIEYMNASGIMASPAHRRNDMHSAMPKSVTPLPGVNDYDAHHCAIPVGWWLSEEDRDLIARTVVEWDKLVSI